MQRPPGEAGGTRAVPPSPGLPRGTKIDENTTPRETQRASRAQPPAPPDESFGGRSQHDANADIAHEPPGATLAEVARALADAFHAAPEWSAPSLLAAGSSVVGSRRAFVRVAVGGILESLPRPLPDSPRLLARLIADLPGFAASFRRGTQRTPVRIRSRAIAPTRAVGPGPRVDTVVDLARLLGVTVGRLEWFADTQGWNRLAEEGPLHHYRYEWRVRPGRVPRLLEVPLDRLRTMQRIILDELLTPMPLHDAAHGFVAGRMAITGAAEHTGRDVVIGLDLVSFFASVTAKQIYGLFRRAGLPETVAHLLTGVCTHSVPPRVLRAMPAGGSASARFALRQALSTPHLPQGAPSSPALANLSLQRLDSRLAGWADAFGATYTRYADDLAFSGDASLASMVREFVRGATAIVVDSGHTINAPKTRIRRAGTRQTVTGIVVNATTAPGRREYDRLRAVVHNCVTHGPEGQNRDGHPAFRQQLLGRIAWVSQLHPERGARLRREFELIRW